MRYSDADPNNLQPHPTPDLLLPPLLAPPFATNVDPNVFQALSQSPPSGNSLFIFRRLVEIPISDSQSFFAFENQSCASEKLNTQRKREKDREMGHTSNDLLHLEHKASSSSPLGSLFLLSFFWLLSATLYGNNLFLMSMLQNPHFLFARMGQSLGCRNLITLGENQSLSHFLQAKVALFSLSLLFLIL